MNQRQLALIAGLTIAVACNRQSTEVRTDPDPILLRVQLPQSASNVVWISEPVVKDGCIPAHDSPTRIHAVIAGYTSEGAPGRMDVPIPIANAILPPSIRTRGVVHDGIMTIEGNLPNKRALERPQEAEIRHALISAEGLTLELWVR